MSSAHATVKAMLEDPFVLALVLHEIGERGGADELAMRIAYWQQADPFLWTLTSLSDDLLGEVAWKGQRGEYETTVFVGEYGADGLTAGPFPTLDDAKASLADYLISENEVTEVFEGCPWG